MARNPCAVVAALLALSPCSWAYEKIGAYMPVSNVLEHSQMSFDVEAFGAALAGQDPDYNKAKFIYASGGGGSCKSPTTPRTFLGFATANLTGESFADAYYNSGKAVNFWNTWFLAALEGTGEFSGLSRVKRVTALKKGVLGLVTFYASHELESAISKAAKAETRSDGGSGMAWDEGWAFYYGASSDGAHSPWEAATEYDGDFPLGSVQVNTSIAAIFNKGLIAVRNGTHDAAAAVEARDAIYTLWALTYIRASFKYLELAENNYTERAHAEGYAWFKAVDGWVQSKSTAAAAALRGALAISKTSISAGTFCAAKAAMERAYAALGIDCSMVGTFKGTVITCPACTAPTAPALPVGADAVLAVAGTASNVNCTPSPPTTEVGAAERSRAAPLLALAVLAALATVAAP